MTTRRLGLLGGTFDPIHMGHLDLAQLAASTLRLTDLLLIPANVPAHRAKPLTSSFHRFAMVALAVSGRTGWKASDLELRHPAPSYTAITLRWFQDRGYGPTELYFLIGADAFADITSWREYPTILDRAQFGVVSRPGCPVTELPQRVPTLASRMVPVAEFMPGPATSIVLIDGPTADVSSTAIRQQLEAGGSIDGMVDRRVQQHIEQHGLYRSSTPDRRSATPAIEPTAGRLHGQD